MAATIEFSAQFGGRDAAAAVLPHFKALKAVARGHAIGQFPFKSMAFILRVDGEINSYELSGPGHLDFDGDNYVSIDIGIPQGDYVNCSECVSRSVVRALQSSVDFMKHSKDARLRGIDFEVLRETVKRLCDSYEEAING